MKHIIGIWLYKGGLRLRPLALLMTGLLGLPLAAAAQDLSFAEAIRLATANSPALKQAEGALRAQAAATTSSWLDLGPRVKASYNEVHYEKELSMATPVGSLVMRGKAIKSGDLTVVQPITSLFALHQKAAFEEINKDSRGLVVDETRSQVAFRAAEAYVQAQQVEKLLAIARERVEAVKSQQRDGEFLLQAGRIHRGDFLKLQLALSQAQSDLARTTAGRESAFYALKESVGLQGSASEVSIPPLRVPEELPPPSLPEVGAAISTAMANRVDMKLKEKQQETAGFSRKLAYARFSPELNVFGKVERNFGEQSSSTGPEKITRSYGLQFSWDIWDNGSRLYRVFEAAGVEAAAAADKEATAQRVRIEMVGILANLKATRESFGLAVAAAAQGAEAYRIEKVKFSSGKSTATELVLAEAAKAGAEGGLVAAYTELVVQQFKLQQALGEQNPNL